MTSVPNVVTDFRSGAVAASETIRRTLPSGSSPERCGYSYCLVRQPSLSRLRAPIKVTAVVSAILGLFGIATAGIVRLLMLGKILPDEPSLVAVVVGCSVGGILLLFLPTFVEGWIVRQHLVQCGENFGFGSEHKGIRVSLEYAPTCGSMKILAEDVGLIYIYPDAHYVKIDGLSYEYAIQSKDVESLSLHSNGKSVLLSYKVGEERLDLAIEPRSLLAELKRQTIGSSRSLFERIQDALGTSKR